MCLRLRDLRFLNILLTFIIAVSGIVTISFLSYAHYYANTSIVENYGLKFPTRHFNISIAFVITIEIVILIEEASGIYLLYKAGRGSIIGYEVILLVIIAVNSVTVYYTNHIPIELQDELRNSAIENICPKCAKYLFGSGNVFVQVSWLMTAVVGVQVLKLALIVRVTMMLRLEDDDEMMGLLTKIKRAAHWPFSKTGQIVLPSPESDNSPSQRVYFDNAENGAVVLSFNDKEPQPGPSRAFANVSYGPNIIPNYGTNSLMTSSSTEDLNSDPQPKLATATVHVPIIPSLQFFSGLDVVTQDGAGNDEHHGEFNILQKAPNFTVQLT